MEVTEWVGDVLDFQREELLGEGARLFLLNHDDEAGYSAIEGIPDGEIIDGWLVSDDNDGDGESSGQLKLEIAESVTATAARLDSFAAVALFLPNSPTAKICKKVAPLKPLNPTCLVWGFSITPTNESWEI